MIRKQKNERRQAELNVLMLLSSFVFAFYYASRILFPNPYDFAVTGALFELLSLPAMLLLISLPVANVVLLNQHKQKAFFPLLVSVMLLAAAGFLLLQA